MSNVSKSQIYRFKFLPISKRKEIYTKNQYAPHAQRN